MKYGDIELLPNSKVYNFCVELLEFDPPFLGSEVSRIYFNSDTNSYRFNNGTEYVDLSLPNNFMSLIDTLGNNWINQDFTFNPTLFNEFKTVSDLTSNSSLYDVLYQMDQAIGSLNAPELADLSDVTIPPNITPGELLIWNNDVYTFTDIDTIIENYSELKVESLKNVNSSSIPDGGTLVFDASQNAYNIVQSSVIIEDFYNTNQHSITHNLGIKYLAVTVINAQTDQVIQNATIQYLDSSSLNITLANAAKILVILTVPFGFPD